MRQNNNNKINKAALLDTPVLLLTPGELLHIRHNLLETGFRMTLHNHLPMLMLLSSQHVPWEDTVLRVTESSLLEWYTLQASQRLSLWNEQL